MEGEKVWEGCVNVFLMVIHFTVSVTNIKL